MTAKKSENPFSAELGDAVDRLRQMADQAGDALFTEGPVNPDHRLLDMCAEIGHRRKLADAAAEHVRSVPMAAFMCKTQEESAQRALAHTERDEASRRYSHLLREASKFPATTAAGIYAKAIAVRAFRTGAQYLAMSLAEDLLACPGLRASLWPAGEDV